MFSEECAILFTWEGGGNGGLHPRERGSACRGVGQTPGSASGDLQRVCIGGGGVG